LKINGESIYGTQASPYAKPAWGRYTAKAGVLYAHIYDWPTNGRLPISSAVKVKAVSFLGGSPKALQYDDKEAAIILPQTNPGAAVSVVKIELKSAQ
jgi:alpha-L-fucosidase